MNNASLINVVLPLLLAPLSFGITNRVKAVFAGRKGQPLLQGYYDIIKLCRKDFVYSSTVSPVFRLAPAVILSSTIFIIAMLPVFNSAPLLSFPGDIIVVVYFFGLARFLLIIGALDTGSSFEGMGASREAFYSLIAELSIFIIFIIMALACQAFSLTEIFSVLPGRINSFPLLLLLACSLFVILLFECCRIPFDDPNTHLELTMIHEVMILDYGSADLAMIEYASALKMWVLASLVVQILVPAVFTNYALAQIVNAAGVFSIALAVGVVESTMARFRLQKIPYILLSLFTLLAAAFIYMRFV
ncbi:MAG: NADH-quinone oxidoreductase subunit H [Chitinispirillaceae bacterium]|jgi:formate hydrogenlyase subunit 4